MQLVTLRAERILRCPSDFYVNILRTLLSPRRGERPKGRLFVSPASLYMPGGRPLWGRTEADDTKWDAIYPQRALAVGGAQRGQRALAVFGSTLRPA